MNAIKRKPMKKAGPRLVNVVITRNASTVGFNVWSAVATDRLHTDAGYANFDEAEKAVEKYCNANKMRIVKTTLVSGR